MTGARTGSLLQRGWFKPSACFRAASCGGRVNGKHDGSVVGARCLIALYRFKSDVLGWSSPRYDRSWTKITLRLTYREAVNGTSQPKSKPLSFLGGVKNVGRIAPRETPSLNPQLDANGTLFDHAEEEIRLLRESQRVLFVPSLFMDRHDCKQARKRSLGYESDSSEAATRRSKRMRKLFLSGWKHVRPQCLTIDMSFRFDGELGRNDLHGPSAAPSSRVQTLKRTRTACMQPPPVTQLPCTFQISPHTSTPTKPTPGRDAGGED